MRILAAAILIAPAAASAQDAPAPTPMIQVVGTGSVSTAPDRATLAYWISGEGKTADEASAALAAKQKAIVAGLSGLLGRDTQLSSGQVSVLEARARQCDASGYNSRPRLSEGECAVTGYVASMQGNVRTATVDKAGTAVGLAARLGARDARLQGFALSDPAEAQRRATAAAIADARVRAEAMATGAKVRLGTLLSLNDQNSGLEPIMVTGARAPAPAAAPAPPPPVEIGVKPQPIETQARVYARFAIAP